MLMSAVSYTGNRNVSKRRSRMSDIDEPVFDEDLWKKIRNDADFQVSLKKFFYRNRKRLSNTQTRFVDLARTGELKTLGGDTLFIGDKDVQRVEQGRLYELSVDRFELLAKAIGYKPKEVLVELGYNIEALDSSYTGEQAWPKIESQDLDHKISRQFGESFSLQLESSGGKRKVFTMPNVDEFKLKHLTWETFGNGIDILGQQIQNVGYHIEVDVCIGINDAGLTIATFLNYAALKRKKLGYIRCSMYQNQLKIDESNTILPTLPSDPSIMLCDFEIKRAAVLPRILDYLNSIYNNPKVYYSVFGAMTESEDLKINSISALCSAEFLPLMKIEEIFIACTMHPPGIEPPLGLK